MLHSLQIGKHTRGCLYRGNGQLVIMYRNGLGCVEIEK